MHQRSLVFLESHIASESPSTCSYEHPPTGVDLSSVASTRASVGARTPAIARLSGIADTVGIRIDLRLSAAARVHRRPGACARTGIGSCAGAIYLPPSHIHPPDRRLPGAASSHWHLSGRSLPGVLGGRPSLCTIGRSSYPRRRRPQGLGLRRPPSAASSHWRHRFITGRCWASIRTRAPTITRLACITHAV